MKVVWALTCFKVTCKVLFKSVPLMTFSTNMKSTSYTYICSDTFNPLFISLCFTDNGSTGFDLALYVIVINTFPGFILADFYDFEESHKNQLKWNLETCLWQLRIVQGQNQSIHWTLHWGWTLFSEDSTPLLESYRIPSICESICYTCAFALYKLF